MAKKQTDIELRYKLNELLLMYRRCILRHAATIRNPERVFIDYEGGPYVYVLYSDSGLSWTCCTHDFNLGGSLLGTYGSDVHLITLAGVPLLLGYHYGYQAFKSMWPVMVASITTILIIEPLLVFGMFREFPTWGTGVGFVLGAVGLYLAVNH
jgi:hypothetical protein